MTEATGVADPELESLALGKLTRVLGEQRGRRLFEETLQQVGLAAVRTADHLYAIGAALSKRGGIEGAVGGLISVAAVMRGAAGR